MTTRLAVLAPLAIEAAALRVGLRRGGAATSEVTVIPTGAGRTAHRRAAATAARLHRLDTPPVVIAGVAGSLRREVAPGTVVVATEVRDAATGRCRALPSAPLLAGELRRAGLPVTLEPLVTAEHTVLGGDRERLAATGAAAVDLESAQLLQLIGNTPAAVIRVIVDAPGAPLVSPATAWRGSRALLRLASLAPLLTRWSEAVGDRQVLRAEPAGFCAGVERAIEAVEKALDRHGRPVYVRRQIVHNSHVVADLARKGARFVDELTEVPPGSVVVLSAHGVGPAVWKEAHELHLTVVDATCPLVAKVHTELRRFVGRGEYVVLIGHAGHDEVEATLAEAPEAVQLVEGPADVARLPDPAGRQVRYLTQTTLAADDVDRVVEALRARFGAVAGPAGEDICYATTNRQSALRQVAADVDLALVVGSRNSANSQRLVEVARRCGTAAHLVEDVGEVELGWLVGVRRIGISAGASAPPPLAGELITALSGLAATSEGLALDVRSVAREDVAFVPPREVHFS